MKAGSKHSQLPQRPSTPIVLPSPEILANPLRTEESNVLTTGFHFHGHDANWKLLQRTQNSKDNLRRYHEHQVLSTVVTSSVGPTLH